MASFDSPIAASLALPRHGGDLAAAEARFGRSKEGWLDLSTGINPFAYPIPALADEIWRSLPDAEAERRLREAAAAAWSVADPDEIVVAPGTQAIIQTLALLRPAADMAILEPTYPGHAQAFAQAGHAVIQCRTIEEMGETQLAVVVNPNNPDGRRTPPEELRALAAATDARGGLLIVDEAFADLTPDLSVAGPATPGLLVLRSFGKFFGLAGLRLGFAVCTRDAAQTLRDALGPWPVSGPALEIGRVALADQVWIEATRAALARESARMDALLSEAGMAILGGTDLFRLAGTPRAWSLFEFLGKRGILVRPFPEQSRWLRFGLPRDQAAGRRLAAALAAWNG